MKFYLTATLLVIVLTGSACSKAESPAATQAAPQATATPVAAPAPSQVKPTITLSRVRIPEKGWVKVYGKGFSPKQDVRSHLRRPDGTEFPVLPILTDDKGEFTHDIETLLLKLGTHDLWVIDSTTGITSNEVHFEVTHDQGPTERPIS